MFLRNNTAILYLLSCGKDPFFGSICTEGVGYHKIILFYLVFSRKRGLQVTVGSSECMESGRRALHGGIRSRKNRVRKH